MRRRSGGVSSEDIFQKLCNVYVLIVGIRAANDAEVTAAFTVPLRGARL